MVTGVDSWHRQDARRQAHRRDVNESREGAERACPTRPRLATFVCECGDPGCGKPVRLSVSEYETVRAHPRHFLIVTNHENPETESVVIESTRFAVVETLVGQASKIALRTDPRALYHDGSLRAAAHG